jgi:hypothetical protein
MESKKCNECSIEKNIYDFHKWKYGPDGYRRNCKECRKKETKKYYENNSEKIKSTVSKYRKKNPEKVKEIKKKIYERNKDNILKVNKTYRENNRKKLNEHQRIKKSKDPIYKLRHNMNARIKIFLNSKNIQKHNKTFEIIGCSPKELKEHIEKQFTDGMCWDKLGKHIHIDHIIPLSSAKNEEEIYKLCHYSNLQPLWALDNIKKGAKIIPQN